MFPMTFLCCDFFVQFPGSQSGESHSDNCGCFGSGEPWNSAFLGSPIVREGNETLTVIFRQKKGTHTLKRGSEDNLMEEYEQSTLIKT